MTNGLGSPYVPYRTEAPWQAQAVYKEGKLVLYSGSHHESVYGCRTGGLNMLKIRHLFFVLGLLLYPATPSGAQVGIGIGLPHVSIGINLPVFPHLVVVPGYPVYYAPRLEANYFFYDGMYWVYQDDYWYASSWYNGPWWLVGPEVVPVFILRIPVRYYRRPPAYFHGWRHDAPPHWNEHWGREWEHRRSGWDRWDRRAAPKPAPLPVYQRQYSKDRYPKQVEQQRELHNQKYRYQPHDPVVRQHFQEQRRGKDAQRPTPASPQQGRPQAQDRGQPPKPRLDQRKQQTPDSHEQEKRQQGKDATRKPKKGQDQDQDRDQERGR